MPDPNQGPRFIEGRAVLGALKGWDKVNKDLIRAALDADPPCRVRKAKSGHVIVTNQYGSTTTIASNGHGRGSKAIKNYQADIRRVLNEHSRKETEPVPDETVDLGPIVQSTALDTAPPPPLPPELRTQPYPAADRPVADVNMFPAMEGNGPPLPCEHCPGRLFANNQSLAVHRGAKHARCDVCDRWVKNKTGLDPHKRAAHGGNQFWLKSNTHAKTQTVDPAVDRAKRKTRGKPVEDVELPAALAARPVEERVAAVETLDRIRELIGRDPAIGVMEATVNALQYNLAVEKKRADDAEAQLALIREAMGLR